jgi:hypothetical protein
MADEDLERDDKEPFFFGGRLGGGGSPIQQKSIEIIQPSMNGSNKKCIK